MNLIQLFSHNNKKHYLILQIEQFYCLTCTKLPINYHRIHKEYFHASISNIIFLFGVTADSANRKIIPASGGWGQSVL